MNRYREVLTSAVERLRQEVRGWCLIRAAPGEEQLVADSLADSLGWARRSDQDDLETAGHSVITISPTLTGAAREAMWNSINRRRDRLGDLGVHVLVVNRRDLVALQRSAGDVFAALRISEAVPFVPRVLSDDELAGMRAQLARHYRDRFGRLDLRGFIRSEGEDASFTVEEIFEPLRATRIVTRDFGFGKHDFTMDGRLVDLVAGHSPALVVGAPGSGKSFFLRWLALKAADGTLTLQGRNGDSPWLPVLVPLAAVGLAPGQPTLSEYAEESLLSDGLLFGHRMASEADAGNVLFLLDGLDEAGDVGSRRAAFNAVYALADRFPRSSILVTTRPAGLDDLIDEGTVPPRIEIQPLDPAAVTSLLTRWCELYEADRAGSPSAGARGRRIGEQLARDVLASPPVRELASSPLLATVIAIVHRAGLRLPDRRVELYDHVIRILIERWNQVRTRDLVGAAPIRVPDALRLLGPVALELVENDREGAIDEATLREFLSRALAAGNVRGLTDAGAAIEMFRSSLGLLVERAPGVYAFLHQTLIEFLAAHELIRTERFLTLVKHAREAFMPRWREVILLGAGILGVLQANDERINQVIRGLVQSARRRPGRPSIAVPRLLGEMLADDPTLTRGQANQLCNELIPTWWFQRRYGRHASHYVAQDARALARRIAVGSWAAVTAARARAAYGHGVDAIPEIDHPFRWRGVVLALDALGLEVAPLICQRCIEGSVPRPMAIWMREFELVEIAGAEAVAELGLSEGMRLLWRHTAEFGVWRIRGRRDMSAAPGPALDDVEVSSCETKDGRTRFRCATPDGAWRPDALMFWWKPDDVARPAVLRAWLELAKQFPEAPQPQSIPPATSTDGAE